MTNPLISVIVPCYNQAQYLDECLQSVLDQTYPHWECIIVNDGSPDNTEEVALEWTKKDTRYIYTKKENGGLSSARNAGLEIVKGEWIQFLDCDDTLETTKFEKSLEFFTKNEIVISQFNIMAFNKKTKGYNHIENNFLNFDNLLKNWGKTFTIPIHCGIFAKSVLANFTFSTEVKTMEDWLMWLKIFYNHPKCHVIEENLCNYRKENNDSLSSDLKQLVHQKIKIYPIIDSIYGKNIFNQLVMHDIEVKSIENLQLKKELKKIQNDFFVAKYIQLKKQYYQLKNKKR